MTRRMKMTTFEHLHIERQFRIRNQREIIAKEMNGDAGALTEREIEQATAAHLLKVAKAFIAKAEGQAITGMASVQSPDEPGRVRLAVSLSDGSILITPGHIRGYT